MSFRMKLALALPYHLVYDDPPAVEPTDEETAAAAAAATATAAEEEKKGKTKVKFTPEQQGYLNSLLAEERRKATLKNDQLITQLETEKNKTTTTAAEKTAIEERIESLRAEFATKDELAQKETKKRIEESTKRATTAEAAAKTWQERFESRTIDTDLTNAAVTHKAFSPKQVVTILKPLTRLVEETDDSGKPTGNWTTRVKIQGKDKDGNPVTLDLPAVDAVKQLTEMPEEYGNLFSSGATGGLGGGTLAGRQGTAGGKAPHQMSTEEYMANRKKVGPLAKR